MPNKDYEPLRFVGDKQKANVEVPKKNGEKETLYNYIPDDDLVKAVNLALLLEMPLLVMGEPGCGKSLLAKAIAYEIHEDKLNDYYFKWDIKSSTKAAEGLYEFDYVHRLRDATIPNSTNSNGTSDVAAIDKYIRLGKMGEAFQKSTRFDKRAVLLIDEIDKADLDFPNDLLNELDNMEFEIREKKTEENTVQSNESSEKKAEKDDQKAKGTAAKEVLPATIKAKYRPIVIITSNSEKDLPDAFLRRCIFHYIAPLDPAKLKEIVMGRFYSKDKSDPIVDKAIDLFVKLRDTIRTELLSVGKNVSTSEFINWFEALKHYRELAVTEGVAKELVAELDQLDLQELTKIPFKNILLKNINSVIRFGDAQSSTTR